MSLKVHFAGWAAALALLAAAPAWAQIGLPSNLTPTQVLPGIGLPGRDLPSRLPGIDDADRLARRTVDRALQAPARLDQMIRRSDGALEADPFGWPAVRGEIVAIDLSDAARARALEAGFTVMREERLEALDLTTLVLAPPRRLSLARAVERLRALDPGAEVTFNHVYSPAGALDGAESGGRAASVSPGEVQADRARLGLIDSGVDAGHPVFAGTDLTQRGFAGPARVGAHGTAVASLMVGRAGPFSGADPGAALLVADIYGGQAAGGSSTGLARALAWMVEQRAGVVNISLVGPKNALIERAVARAQARGTILVAAVGNDGPAAAPLYPASYPGVIGVTGVGANDRVLPEAARGPQVDLAAPGADMAAAGQGGSYVAARGTSFAAPVVAGLIARHGGVAPVSRSATDLGDRGADYVYGAGLVGGDLRVSPRSVGARGRLNR